MEAISSLANTANKAIWGENGVNSNTREEPISGVKGDTSHGEPFDAGNIEDPTEAMAREENSGQARNAANNPKPDDDGGPIGTRDEENPSTETTTNGQNVTTGSAGVGNAGKNFAHPGPQPLEKVAKQHGGDAGNPALSKGMAGKDDDDASPKSPSSSSLSNGDGDGDSDGDQAKDKDKNAGTGEKYIKTSGLQADGGDFDASRAGAGREADRLMEEKGIHKETSNSSNPGDSNKGTIKANGVRDKRGLGQKIKEKLHRH